MGIDPATAMMAASAASSLIGGSKNKGGTPAVQGFAAYPKEVQETLLGLLPQMQKQGTQPFQAMPMQRAQNPGHPGNEHASPELYKLQQYSDAVGGLFNPMGGANQGQAQNQQSNPAATAQNPAGMSPQQLAAQYLQGTMGGSRAPNSQLQPMISQGRTDLGAIGNALLGQGYNGTSAAPSSVNFEALYRSLGL